jgi:hypothetical protein
MGEQAKLQDADPTASDDFPSGSAARASYCLLSAFENER